MEEADASVEKAGDKVVIGLRINQEAHRNGNHEQANEYRIVIINQIDSFMVAFFINGIIELSKIIAIQRFLHLKD